MQMNKNLQITTNILFRNQGKEIPLIGKTAVEFMAVGPCAKYVIPTITHR